jgi:hypothetical protein
VDVGRFREAVQYVQKAAKALYEAARDVFEQVKVSLQRLVELFVEAVTRVLAWVDKHKAYLFLMAAVAAGAVALSVALNVWGLIELEKLAYAASLAPFATAGVKKYSREEVFNILKNAPDPYEKSKKMARDANAGKAKLPQPWESLRVLILPKRSEEKRLMVGGGAELYSKYREDENYKRALFYAVLALEEAFGFYRSALRKYMEGLREAVQRVEAGEEPFKRVVYMPDLGLLTQLTKEEGKAFENALRILRERLNEYAVKYGLRDLLDVDEDMARRLAEAEVPEFSEFNGVNFGVKALAALIAYREYALGRRGAYGIAAWHWLELGGSAWLFYYAPRTAYDSAKRTKVERPMAVEEIVAEALRRLFLKPGADHYSHLVEELTKGGRLALMLEKEAESSYVFRLYNMKESGELVELGIELWISKVGEGKSIIYWLTFDMKMWREFFGQMLEAAEKVAVEIRERLPVEDRFPYMLGWVDSDVAISGGRLEMSTSHLWQLAETHALFDWPDIVVFRVNLTLEGPKPQFLARTSLEKLDDAIKKSVDGGWLKMLGTKAGLEDLMHVKSWKGLKQWVADHWGIVVDAAVKRLGEEVRGELEALRNKLDDDKIAREVVAPALLLIQAEKFGVNETTLRYFAAVVSGAIGGDGYVSSAEGKVVLTSGKHAVALLWGATLAAYSIEAKVRGAGSAIRVITSGGDATRVAGLFFLYGPPLLEGDDRLKSHKLAGAMELSAKEALNIRWEGLRLTKSGVAADLIISEAGIAVKYNIYLRNKIGLYLESADRSRVELAARLLQRAGITTKVQKEGGRDEWYVKVTTDMLAAGREELRKALAEIVEAAVKNGLVDASKAEGWLKKLERGCMLKEGWPKYYVGLTEGALEVRFSSTKPHKIEREAQRLRDMGLVESVHFTMKMPEGGAGYLYILRKGLEYVAWLSVYGEGERQRLAAEFVKYILRRAWEEGEEVYEKAKEIIEKGKTMGSLTLKGVERRVEVGGREHVVKVIDGSAEIEERQDGKPLLRIKITAEVDGIRREYAITYGRYERNATVGFATAKADAPGGRETDAERLAAVIKALTGEEPKIRRMKDGTIIIKCYGRHLEGFKRYAELADVIAKWLK